ncbi:MAG: DsbC family protein [Neisseriaceae bacterium]|nr:DsbC family protein [Neisseriaceae bacterium]
MKKSHQQTKFYTENILVFLFVITLLISLLGIYWYNQSLSKDIISHELLDPERSVHFHTEAEQAIRQALAGTRIDTIKITPIANLFEVTAGKNVFYSDPTGRYLLFGHLYDVKEQTDLTPSLNGAATQNPTENKITWNSLPLDSAIVTGKSGGVPVAVFIDPDCGYCRALQAELARNTTLEVFEFLMPLTQIHSEALQKSKAIWCSANRAQALNQVMAGQAVDMQTSCDTQALDAITKFAQQHNFNGTPILVRQDGTVFWGYQDLSALTAWAMAGQGKQ